MYTEEELLPISALQHMMFCERQCALIHLERAWEENRFTAEGRILHERVEEGGIESRGDVRIEYSVPLRSLRLGVAGVADVVEFHRVSSGWRVFPVEYKRGKPKPGPWDEVQLCAQALCLEEMLSVGIERGALYYGKIRRRREVEFVETLKVETEKAAKRVHDLIRKGRTPRAELGEKCKRCSIANLCLPKSNVRFRSAKRYLDETLQSMELPLDSS
jgi:CRISPR-associated exonuclease Cas4